MRWGEVPAPIDALGVAVDDVGVCGVRFGGAPAAKVSLEGLLERAADELARYFGGEPLRFTVPLSVPGGSDFERAVWRELYAIPYGEMRTYGQIASAVGEPDAARAVGVACNRNPIPVIIPCHRVVGADGKLVGFGGGLWRKKVLLELEARVRIELEFGFS
ncbi:methylated-DNA--[protein]-cysteine S-methyltransferase [Dactylosporangium roseum]|uniref:Methylated-DNA--protein-cysteine methyltransferase n=1 Tax=Dactylosporangium roseum TaxID=47989 RepID=A0ABY5Z6S8_9ACTN|nr:methylated-DNA--[protein]-cysteine S-methyltransferase [Dactylosporangium roseum]UWZ36763.1 methylated-DNA--[protein]-cysteine S-methyltransferase [Dactylosporangium roseum]